MAKTPKTRIHPIVHIGHGLVLSRTEAWAWFRIPEQGVFLRSIVENEQTAHMFSQAMASLVSATPNDPLDVHLRSVRRRFNTDAWAENLTRRALPNNPPPALNDLVGLAAEHLDAIDGLVPETYLGVKLGDRKQAQAAAGGAKSAFASIKKTLTDSLAGPSLDIDPAELDRWRIKVKHTHATLTSSLEGATVASAADLIWLMRKPFYPVADCPDTDIPQLNQFNATDITLLTTGFLHTTPTDVTVRFPNVDGTVEEHSTTIAAITRFSDIMAWPENLGWSDHVRTRHPDAEWSIRARIIPPALVKKNIKKGVGDIAQEIHDSHQSGHDGGRKLQEQHANLAELEYQASNDPHPWVQADYRVQLRGVNSDEVSGIYSDLAINLQSANLRLTRPPHDQMDMLLSFLPGSGWRTGPYTRQQSVSMLSGGGLFATHAVGDDGVLGPYLGRVAAGSLPPVFFDPNRAIALNQGPVTAVTGSPGQGKTMASLTLAYQCAARGYKTIYIDPKADAVGFAGLPGMGRVTLLDLKDGQDGLLDPFALGADLEESGVFALEVVKGLMSDWTEARESAVMQVIEDVKNAPTPSLWALSELCLQQPKGEAAYNIGLQLKQLRSAPFGKLLFAQKPPTQRLAATDGLTVVTLLGLETPNPDTDAKDYTYNQRIGVAVMYLLARYAQGLMLAGDKNAPKALFIDEAWAILGTTSGQALVNGIARMGRSHNTSLVLISQSVRDFLDAGIANQCSTRLAFGSNDPSEHAHQVDFLGVDVDSGAMQVMANLPRLKGHCLMKDALGRAGIVHIDPYRTDLFAAFDTNPETRGRHTS